MLNDSEKIQVVEIQLPSFKVNYTNEPEDSIQQLKDNIMDFVEEESIQVTELGWKNDKRESDINNITFQMTSLKKENMFVLNE